jgi:hypothetical protein
MSRFAESGGVMHTREELIGFIDLFLDAVGHNDPSRLPVSPNARYTENCQVEYGYWYQDAEANHVDILLSTDQDAIDAALGELKLKLAEAR